MPDATAGLIPRRAPAAWTTPLWPYRHAEAGRGRGGRASSNNGVAARCGCARRIRVAESVLGAGARSRGVCGTDFKAAAPA